MEYKNALITGTSSGLGEGLARWFAARGTRVYAAARRRDRLEELARAARESGALIEPLELDVNDTERVIAEVERLDRDSGGLDLVIANAGVGGETNGKDLHWKEVERILQTNVMGAAATLSAAVPGMVGRGKGHLVGMGSLSAYRGLAGRCAYSGSKAFLTTFLESLRIDLKGTGVQVTVLQPGFVKSELTARHKNKLPFLLETADAVDRMGKAILRGSSEFAFPLPTASVMRLAKYFPNKLWDATALRMFRR